MPSPRVTDVQIQAVGRDETFLQWHVRDLGVPMDRWRVQVAFSYSESGPWDDIVMPPTTPDVASFLHKGRRADRWSPPFYRIDLIEKTPTHTRVWPSEPVFPRHPPDATAEGLHRRLTQLLESHYGVEVFFLKKRVEGREDPQAFNDQLHRLTGHAGESYGQRFVGGFYAPMRLWAKLNPHPLVRQPLPVGDVHHTVASCWIGGRPFLAPGDLIVERHTNKRWRIKDEVNRVHWRQTCWRQVFAVDEIPIADIEYDVPVADRG